MLNCKNCKADWSLYGKEYKRMKDNKIDYYCTFCGCKKAPEEIPGVHPFFLDGIPKGIKIENNEKDNKIETSIKSKRVLTIEDLIVLSKIDTSAWELERFTTNSWESGGNTNYQIKAFWKKKDVKLVSLEEIIKNISPAVHIPLKKRDKNGLLHEICLFDHHFGKFAWEQETGENFDLKIAKKRFVEAVVELSLWETNPERILFPIGNDFLHINSDMNTTAGGTPQDVDTRFKKVFQFAFDSIIDSIFTLSKIAPVDILYIPSNHDNDSCYFLCFSVAHYFKNNENISVDISPKYRKSYVWGDNSIFFDHGEMKPEKLVNILSTEFPNEWCNAKFREVHCGHFHKKQEINFLTADSFGSMIYRRIPSLTGTDAWHYKNGFIGSNKAAQSFLWHKENGQIASYQHNLKG